MASKALEESGIDIGVLDETRLDGYHTSFCEGYNVIATKASSIQGGVAILIMESEHFQVEGIQTHGENSISFYIT